MEFYSIQFVFFVAIGLLIHGISAYLFSNHQWIVRLVLSIAYYFMISKESVIFIILSSLSVYYGAKWIGSLNKNKLDKTLLIRKRIILYCIIIANLVVLVLVKGISQNLFNNITIPIGISFYTFMGISYLVDVYSGKNEYENNYFKLLLFMIWFPQLLQGPINRYNEQRKSLYNCSFLTWETVKYALYLILFDTLKKYAIANPLSFPVERVFDGDLSQKPGAFLFLGAFMFAIQQYADFSGGIDIVLGISLMFGVKMKPNFRQPYFSKSVSEFWRRWHISLGAFMKDYVFFPFILLKPMQKLMTKLNTRWGSHISRSVMGGIANLLVFTLVGIWHGLQVHYILWGLYNGIIIAISDALKPIYTKTKVKLHINDKGSIYGFFAVLRTFLIIVLAGFFDRVSDVKQCIICFKNLFLHFEINTAKIWIRTLYEWEALTEMKIHLIIASCLIVLVNSVMCEKNKTTCLYHFLEKKSIIVRWSTVYIMILLVMSSFIFTKGNIGFMYEQF